MRSRKASVSAAEVILPRTIRRPASAIPSVVRSVMARLFVGAEDVWRLGRPGEARRDALHQLEQAEIALVEVPDVLFRQLQTGEGGARSEFLECRWCLGRLHVILPVEGPCNR